MKFIYTITLILLSTLFMANSCKKTQSGKSQEDVINELLATYENGEIALCKYKKDVYFKCSRNAADAGSEIFDDQGEKLGGCYAQSRTYHKLCDKFESCDVLWRTGNNIWNKPAVSKLGGETAQPRPVEKLFELFKDGEILSCDYNGQVVYKCAHNAYDVGNEIYDENAEKIGSCYWNSGKVDEMCRQLEGCKDVYRVKDNIWGRPAVNHIFPDDQD